MSRVDSPLFTVHLDSEQSTFHTSIFILFLVGGRAGGAVKAKTSQVPDMFPEEFSIPRHFYHICFGKCSKLLSRTSDLGSIHSFLFLERCANQIGLLPPKKTELGSHLI